MTVTRTGAELGAGALVLAGTGLAAGYPELVLIAAAGAAALGAAICWAAWFRPHLEISRSWTPAYPRAGHTLTVALRVTNLRSRPSPTLSAVEEVAGARYRVEFPPTEAFGRGTGTYQVPALRRGRLQVRRAAIGCYDPLGLVGSTLLAGQREEIRVHPDWHPRIGSLPARGPDPGLAETAGLPRGDVVFHSLRDYRPGDPPRMIHWRASAKRGGAPVVRQSADPEEPVQVLVLDTAATAYHPAAFEEAVRIIASLAVAAYREGLGLELRSTGAGELLAVEPSGRPPGDYRAVLDPLCDVSQSWSVADLGDVVGDLASTTADRGGSAVLGVVAGRSAEAASGALARATRVFEAVYVIRVGAGPCPAPSDGVAHIDVDASGDFAAAMEAGWWP
jgi:uncharacterized protein (DUF58 family)